MAKRRQPLKVESLTHEAAGRTNIPSAEHRLCQISDHGAQRGDVSRARRSLARSHLRDQPAPARKEQPALLGQRDVGAASSAHPEVLPQLVKRRTEARG